MIRSIAALAAEPFAGPRAAGDGAIHIDGVRKRALETGRTRLLVAGALFLLAFAVIAGRMIDVALLRGAAIGHARTQSEADAPVGRADVVDRNGVLLATSLPTESLYARPREVLDPAEAARRVVGVLPDLDAADIEAKLRSDRAFVYLRRNLTPRQEYAVNALGIPGLYFEKGEKRVYPQGNLAAQLVGLDDLDNRGVAGIEKSFDHALQNRHEPLRLSLDIRVQTVLHDELAKAMAAFTAVGATGIVMDARTGEVLAMVSLPDFDPNSMAGASPDSMFDRASLGVYEMGSTFKLFNTAAALDSGTVNLASSFDASQPIHVARYEITDYHPQNRWLTVPEILVYSSNIGSARMALDMGTATQKSYLERFGMLAPTGIELPETGAPLYPTTWREINTMTIAFGHGMAVTPLHVAAGVSAIVNGGVLHPATLLARADAEPVPGERVIKPETSRTMRELMRMVVTDGTGEKADVPGYEVGGKTGTAEKTGVGGYRHKSLLSSFVAAFPIEDPRYVVLAMIDEPHGTKESAGYATAGWTAAPAVGRIVAQIGPMLDVAPAAAPGPADARLRVAQAPERQGVPHPSPLRKVSLAEAE